MIKHFLYELLIRNYSCEEANCFYLLISLLYLPSYYLYWEGALRKKRKKEGTAVKYTWFVGEYDKYNSLCLFTF